MNRIQQWFERLAGVSQGDLDRQAQAARIFGTASFDASLLEIPACWRRKGRNASPGN